MSEGPPARVEGLLARNPNLLVDLSGMHFQRKPALASETGPLDPDEAPTAGRSGIKPSVASEQAQTETHTAVTRTK